MRLRAIRLAEFGTFFDGVALPALSGGLNVLIGANERGKSTILRALNVVFSEPYTAQNKSVRACRSYRGGAPLVETEFEINGSNWRLRKRFLAGRSAELVALASGQTWRNGEAEERLGTLLASHTGIAGARGLLWVEQTKSFSMPTGREQEQLGGALEAFIRREAAAVAGGEQLVQVQALVREALAALMSPVRKAAKKGGAYAQAKSERERLARELEDVRGIVAQGEERIRELGLLKASEAAMKAPENKTRMLAEMEASRHALEAGRTARERLQSALLKVAAAQATADQAGAVAAAMRERVAALAEAEASAGIRREALLCAETKFEVAEQDLRKVEAVSEDHERRLKGLELRLQDLLRSEREAELMMRRGDVLRCFEGARSAAVRRASALADLGSIVVSADDVSRLRDMASEMSEVRAAIAAGAAMVRVTYEAGAAGAFEIDQVKIEDGGEVSIGRAMTIRVPGVGALAISPGRTGDADSYVARLAVLEEQHAAMTARLGGLDLSACAALVEKGSVLKGEAEAATAEINALAPEGLEALEQRLAEFDRELAELAASEPSDEFGDILTIGAVRGAIGQLNGVLSETHVRREAAREAYQKAQLGLETAKYALEAQLLRCRELSESLPGAGEREARLAALDAERAEQQSLLNEAVRQRDAWRERAPSDVAFEGIQQQFKELQSRIADEDEKLRAIEARIALLTARIDDFHENEARGRLEELAAEHDRAVAAVDDYEVEIEALELIDSALSQAELDIRNQVLAPLSARLGPYIARVFGGAKISLGGPLDATEILRDSGAEHVEDLSDGTREQIAVMIRLAYARLFAERGEPVPLILDDALVFADDGRLNQMFGLLQEAGEHHQVIVLTCHDRGFRPLACEFGANPLALERWNAGGQADGLSRAG